MQSERGFTAGDVKAMGITADDLNQCFEHKKAVSKNPGALRQSSQNLQKETKKDKLAHDFSNLDLKSLEKEILNAKLSADNVRLISALQSKVKHKALTTIERKKVLLELLLELLNARKLHLLEDHFVKYKDLIAQEVDEQGLAFKLAFGLLEILVDFPH
jgi:hypothetical protein